MQLRSFDVDRLTLMVKSPEEQLHKLRKSMGVKGGIYERKLMPGEMGGRWAELGASYSPRMKSRLLRVFAEGQLSQAVKTNQKGLNKLLSEGRVILPRTRV